MFIFVGRSEHNLDEKGRLTVPQRLRDGLADGYFLTHGIEPCLWLLSAEMYEKLTGQLSQKSLLDVNTRRFVQLFFGDAVKGELDSQGRMIVAPELREAAGIPDDVPLVVVGALNHIELWAPEAWRAYHARLQEDKVALAAPLGDVG